MVVLAGWRSTKQPTCPTIGSAVFDAVGGDERPVIRDLHARDFCRFDRQRTSRKEIVVSIRVRLVVLGLCAAAARSAREARRAPPTRRPAPRSGAARWCRTA